jgi:putative molybdopterin biosynthesis protein
MFSGSHDPALEEVVLALAEKHEILTLFVGSLNGLTNLRQGLCHATGIHLQDESGEYNRPYVRHFFPDREVELVTLAYRTQGLMLAPGNPKRVKRLEDLRRPDVRFVNRNAGSGTRVWLDAALQRAGIDRRSVRGYQNAVTTHTQAAWWIKSGKADTALGLQASAHESGLDFVPLFQERYDLVVPRETEKRMAPLLDYIQTGAFRTNANAMTGYDTAHSGEFISI